MLPATGHWTFSVFLMHPGTHVRHRARLQSQPGTDRRTYGWLRTFLNKYYAAGNFLVSGRKIPRDGGIILAVGKTRQQIEAIVKEDPFHKHGLADFRIIEFRASQKAGDIQARIGSS
jgi:YCII-related domain